MFVAGWTRVARAAALGLTIALGVAGWTGLVPVASVGAWQAAPAKAPALPARLTDGEFWKVSGEISEPGGFFRITDNFTSNEAEVGRLMTMLRERGVKGGVYIGVGPEQNFSYIAAIRPDMAFIIDIRRQAVMQHLMFKAVFELSRDRADFISLLFGKPRPAGLEVDAPIQRIWDAYFTVATDLDFAMANRRRVIDHLVTTRKLVFTTEESRQLEWVLSAFVDYGPTITTRGQAGRGSNNLTFADLTGWSHDVNGVPQSFLSSDGHFQFVKSLHEKNLIVPVSGDFGGDKALRAIGAWLHKHGGTVSAFYVSNVEQYLFQDDKNRAFYDNVATLPVNDASVFIRPYSLRRHSAAAALCPIAGFLKAATAGRVMWNDDALACRN